MLHSHCSVMAYSNKRVYILLTMIMFAGFCLMRLVFEDNDDVYTPKVYAPQASESRLNVYAPLKSKEATVSLSKCGNGIHMPDTKYSKMTLNRNNESSHTGNITVMIITYDFRNVLKSVGGDVIVIWAYQKNGDGRSSGHVIDHFNGSYTGFVQIYWTGHSMINAKITSTFVNTCLRYNALKKYGNTVFANRNAWGIHGEYRSGIYIEKARCGANPFIYGYTKLCNFTNINGQIPWYCGAPRKETFNCSDIYSFGTGPFNNSEVKTSEKIVHPGHGVLHSSVSVNIVQNPISKPLLKCHQRPKLDSWIEQTSSGYWLNGKWRFANCDNNMQQTNDNYKKCLTNKNVFILGDSTLRQYLEYFVEHLLGLGRPDYVKNNVGQNRSYHGNNTFTNNNINLVYQRPEMPFHQPDLPANGITSIPEELDKIALNEMSGDSIIVVVNYFTHLQAYPASAFRVRIHRLVLAITNLMLVKPDATVLFKGPNVCIDDVKWFDTKIALSFRDIVMQEFFDIRGKVIYLDSWSISVAHNNEKLHPSGDAFISQIHQFMSYICKY